MTTPTSWRTDDPCPICSTGLYAVDTGTLVLQDCRLCGWSTTWQADLNLDDTARESSK